MQKLLLACVQAGPGALCQLDQVGKIGVLRLASSERSWRKICSDEEWTHDMLRDMEEQDLVVIQDRSTVGIVFRALLY